MISKKTLKLFILVSLALTPLSAMAGKVQIATTTTDLMWAARSIGGDYVEVTSMLKGHENPHYIDAVPSFVLKASRADVVCFVGLELESAWLPKVLSRSGNAKVQKGGPGHCNTGEAITPLGVPTTQKDRSHGHVHAAGNPHYWLNPKTFAHAGKAIADAIIRVKPEIAKEINSNYSLFLKDMLDLLDKMRKKVGPVANNLKVMEYHEEFAYFFNAIGIESSGSLEEKPGVPPSASQIARMAIKARKQNINVIIASSNSPKRTIDSFVKKSGVTVPVITNVSLQPDFGEKDYKKMMLSLTDELVKKVKSSRNL